MGNHDLLGPLVPGAGHALDCELADWKCWTNWNVSERSVDGLEVLEPFASLVVLVVLVGCTEVFASSLVGRLMCLSMMRSVLLAAALR